jgi:DNA adenine methylase
MRYFGGKARIAAYIAPILMDEINHIGATRYIEPFIGGASVFCRVKTDVPRIGLDACSPLIALWKYVQSGGELPDTVTEAEYQAAKAGLCEPWAQAFIGFGCSFAGKWFGGYAKSGSRNYAANAKNSLAKRGKLLRTDDTFLAEHYNDPRHDLWNNAVIYCDPPYAGTTGYSAVGTWSPQIFWRWVAKQAKCNTVLVSEYTAPSGVPLVWEKCVVTDIRGGAGKIPRRERLYRLGPEDVTKVKL